MDDAVATFISLTCASQKKAEDYLRVSDGQLEQAVQLYFEMSGMDIGAANPELASPPARSSGRPPGGAQNQPISVDEDVEMVDDEDADLQAVLRASEQSAASSSAGRNSAPVAIGSTRPGSSIVEDDEAIARRLQEELYTDTTETNGDGVRAPMQRTTETLVGPEDDYVGQMASRTWSNRRGAPRVTPGIFNPRPPPSGSVWEAGSARRYLAETTAGASEQSAKRQSLAEMYRPPYEIIDHLDLDEAREQAKELQKWILVNVQDTSIFDCQVLNRDIWKAKEVKDTIKENFIFLQYDRTGADGQLYVRRYFPHAQDVPPMSATNPFPIIAIVDPRTGEQVKVWTETPKKPLEFVMQLHEFLDRYSLDNTARNPVQKPGQSTRKLDVDHMTEEEMMELALKNSLNNGTVESGVRHDPDELTREEERGKGKGKQAEEDNLIDFDDDEPPAFEETPFQAISKKNNHVEPPMDPKNPRITRIQFKLADGSRMIRRFSLDDQVIRIYEWIKADLLPEQAAKKGEEVTEAISNKQFELVSMGKNLIDQLDSTLEEAQLKMGTVMIEFVDNE